MASPANAEQTDCICQKKSMRGAYIGAYYKALEGNRNIGILRLRGVGVADF